MNDSMYDLINDPIDDSNPFDENLPRTKRGLKRYQDILDTAAALFFDAGYADTSINEIVRQAGGSMTSAYKWFVNKEGLFKAVFARAAQRAGEMIKKKSISAPTLQQSCRLLIEVLFDTASCIGNVDTRRTFFTECLNVPAMRHSALRFLKHGLFVPFRNQLNTIADRFEVRFTIGLDAAAMNIIRISRCMLIEYVFSQQPWEIWRPRAVQQTLEVLLALIEIQTGRNSN